MRRQVTRSDSRKRLLLLGLVLCASILGIAKWFAEVPPSAPPPRGFMKPLPLLAMTMPHEGKRYRALLVAHHGQPDRSVFPFEVAGLFDPSNPQPDGPEGFLQNATFTEFLHQVIAAEAPSLPSTQRAALALGQGELQVVDGRSQYKGLGEPAPEDIFGSFDVDKGLVVPGSYRRNLAHKVLTDKGVMQIESSIYDRLIHRMGQQVTVELQREKGKA